MVKSKLKQESQGGLFEAFLRHQPPGVQRRIEKREARLIDNIQETYRKGVWNAWFKLQWLQKCSYILYDLVPQIPILELFCMLTPWMISSNPSLQIPYTSNSICILMTLKFPPTFSQLPAVNLTSAWGCFKFQTILNTGIYSMHRYCIYQNLAHPSMFPKSLSDNIIALVAQAIHSEPSLNSFLSHSSFAFPTLHSKCILNLSTSSLLYNDWV